MTLIGSIGAGMFSTLAVGMPTTNLSLAAQDTLQDESANEAAFTALFASEINSVGGTKGAGTFIVLPDVREFPALGTPANLTNVPRYGYRTSAQVQGQADPQNMEITLNYVAQQWAKGTLLGDSIRDGVVRAFRFAMLNQPAIDGQASLAAEIGTVENSLFYFLGKMESIVYTPSLTDANQATLTISMLSDMYGAFTVDPA